MGRRQLAELNLLDRFLFNEAMEDPENMKMVLDIIFEQDISLKSAPQSEKEVRTLPDNRQVRLDVYAWDEEENVYDTEAQKEDTKNLPKRSRFYQALLDCNLMEPGSIDFNALNNVFIITIAPFDIFGKGLYKYTFRMKCEEDESVRLEDGATRIFLNCHGTHPESVNPELIELLKYMEHSTNETARRCHSEKIQLLHQKVCQIRSSERVEAKFMKAWEEKEMERQKAFAEGENKGIKLGEEKLSKLIVKLTEVGRESDVIKAASDEKYREKLFEEFKVE